MHAKFRPSHSIQGIRLGKVLTKQHPADQPLHKTSLQLLLNPHLITAFVITDASILTATAVLWQRLALPQAISDDVGRVVEQKEGL